MDTANQFDDPKFDADVALMLDQHIATLGKLLGHIQANELSAIMATNPADTEARERSYHKIQAVKELDQFIRNCASRHEARMKEARKQQKA